MHNIRRRLIITMSGALLALGLVPGNSGAATYLHGGAATGNVLAAGTVTWGQQATPAVLSITGLGTVTCTSGDATGISGASGGATITGTMTTMTYNNCTDTIPVITVTGCGVVPPLPTVVGASSSSTGGSENVTNAYVRCTLSGGTSGCYYYAANAAGTYTNSTHLLAFSSIAVTHTVPAGGTGDLGSLCGSTGTLSGTVGPTTVTANGTTVWMNNTP